MNARLAPVPAGVRDGATLRFARVTKLFDTREGDEVCALDDFDLTIAPGEFVAVVGPSGCGKSTLLSLAAGLDTPTAGHVSVDGKELARPHPESATVFQADQLLPWRSVLDNILLPLGLREKLTARHRERAEAWLKQVGLEGFGNKYPHELSGGMRQRVSLCRALIQNPRLLLMDEPFGALDALTREQMIADLQALWTSLGNSVLFITHGIDEAVFLADRVIVMSPRPGRIALELPIPLPRPRRWKEALQDPAFHALMAQVRETFEAQGVLHV
ncbi:MAG: ABC transporter ATP-binding protein [Pigmentiphaga sp.]|uniref:ABC transporter ATP-binding protein n=1 Tax=Pigmentiphaga sp. TaxID=1977564 RepID=UPI0029B7F945|nr:ABC transporter ATP-binding protein [Pigmentiphaga sp.]MDX3906124.1 ABC transporter ATP-binding protein [Pigmentiphaga sp.]